MQLNIYRKTKPPSLSRNFKSRLVDYIYYTTTRRLHPSNPRLFRPRKPATFILTYNVYNIHRPDLYIRLSAPYYDRNSEADGAAVTARIFNYTLLRGFIIANCRVYTYYTYRVRITVLTRCLSREGLA